MEKRDVHGKPVFIFRNHNEAFAAWAEIAAGHKDELLLLLTIDHHTDTHEAFIGWAYKTNGRPIVDADSLSLIEERLARIDLKDRQSVRDAVDDLRNDEQVDAAIRLGVFDYAFCFNSQSTNTPLIEVQQYYESSTRTSIPTSLPLPYEDSKRKTFEIGATCRSGCKKMPHDDDCIKPAADQAIESVMLSQLLDTANLLAKAVNVMDVTKVPYVLDVDLDYFRTKRALSPGEPEIFHNLIRGAVAITIATEPRFIEFERLDQDLTSEYSLEQIIQHINQALSA